MAVDTIANAPGLDQTSKSKHIVLTGNPNVGKSALFSALTGIQAEVSNFPGTTIEIFTGKLGNNELADTPGIYGVSSFNDEERIARKIILKAETVINVVSALSLERDLFLTLQLLDMGKPMLLAVNQWDEAQERGMKIDLPALAESLGIPVIPTVAVCKKGVDELNSCLGQARRGIAGKLVLACIEPLLNLGVETDQAVLIAEGDEASARNCGVAALEFRNEIYRDRRNRVNELVQSVVRQADRQKRFSSVLGRLLLNPLYGSLIAALVCYLIFYQLLGVFVAGTVVDFTEKKLMRASCEPSVRSLVGLIFPSKIEVKGRTFDFPAGTFFARQEAQDFELLRSSVCAQDIKYNFWSHKNILSACGNALAGEYGILTLTLTYLLGLICLDFFSRSCLLFISGFLFWKTLAICQDLPCL